MFEHELIWYAKEFLITFPLVILSGFLILWIYHAVSPKMYFSPFVQVYKNGSRNYTSYSIRTLKMGRVNLIDTKIKCRLVIPNIAKSRYQIKNFYEIPITLSNSLRIGKGVRDIHLKLHESDISKRGTNLFFDRYIEIGREDCGLRLEDVFMTYKNSYIVLYVIGQDSFTGIKKLYRSHNYYFRYVREGSWPQITKGKTLLKDLDLILK